MGFGLWETLLLCFVVLLLFGKRLPGLGRALGLGVVEFKKGLGGDEEKAEAVDEPTPKKPKALDYTPDTPED